MIPFFLDLLLDKTQLCVESSRRECISAQKYE